ncbi:hypothetical protein AB0F77_20960 [Streptomyces sp. NPDC026672]|uniref:DUF6907 domain-containing protein n=1 Tax=unclassified Streptomyces TaxID=2593676 RepID=UPI0033FC47E6
MSSEPRTITLSTVDHGDVTFTCPPWCTAAHESGGYRIDITHTSDDQTLTLPTRRAHAELLTLGLEVRPYVDRWPGTRPFVSIGFGGDYYPTRLAGLESMAIELERHAEVVREYARTLALLLAGGAQ